MHHESEVFKTKLAASWFTNQDKEECMLIAGFLDLGLCWCSCCTEDASVISAHSSWPPLDPEQCMWSKETNVCACSSSNDSDSNDAAGFITPLQAVLMFLEWCINIEPVIDKKQDEEMWNVAWVISVRVSPGLYSIYMVRNLYSLTCKDLCMTGLDQDVNWQNVEWVFDTKIVNTKIQTKNK